MISSSTILAIAHFFTVGYIFIVSMVNTGLIIINEFLQLLGDVLYAAVLHGDWTILESC